MIFTMYGYLRTSSSSSYLFSFRESVQDYKIHMDMEIVEFAEEI